MHGDARVLARGGVAYGFFQHEHEPPRVYGMSPTYVFVFVFVCPEQDTRQQQPIVGAISPAHCLIRRSGLRDGSVVIISHDDHPTAHALVSPPPIVCVPPSYLRSPTM